MTYLNLVNAVLLRLRESSVDSVDENTYSLMIGQLVNDAKKIVEESWMWSAQRETLTVLTVGGTQTYSLTGSANNIIVESVSYAAGPWFLSERSKTWLIKNKFSTTMQTAPQFYIFDGVDSNGDSKVSFYPIPDDVYSIDFEVFQREAELSADDDVTLIPSQPIIMLALALAARERGEVGGQTAAELFAVAHQSLGDAIALDNSKNDTALDWNYA